ncbi:MAG: UDP-2,3-diacylglucosamine diphosphatase [Tannerella sp.]|jgi:UDP-2,3-diacylglucosamine hydrolase|nr:UDP-2,3-diacylglucosamine diphosphatase [Tannerella sp.]
MPSKKIYFASDIHLGNGYLDNPPDVEKKLVQWLDGIKKNAAAIYFLGDIFDYWYEYKYVVPRGHVRFLGKLAELSDIGIKIHFFTGNHDIWMFNYFKEEIGIIIHREPLTVELLGKKFFLGHGDEVGYRPLKYRIIQRILHNRLCQILYATIHPRWTFGFARRWSLSSRKSGLKAEKINLAQTRNAKALEIFAKTHLKTHPDINFFMFGHLHILLDRKIAPDTRLIIIGDWMQLFSYAEWDGTVLELKKLAE